MLNWVINMKKPLIRSDGNGDVIIPKWFIIVVSLCVAFAASVASFVAAQTTMRSDIDIHNDQIRQILSDTKELQATAYTCDKAVSIIDSRLTNIENTLVKIEAKIG